MSHVTHIANRKQQLEARFFILKCIREFFWSHGFVEIEAPYIVRVPGQEPNIRPMRLMVHDEKTRIYEAYLHTSPEYAMKKMLGAGMENIFFLGKCFRDYESFGGRHNPEFTLLEYYRVHADMYALMDDVEELIGYIMNKLKMENRKREMGELKFQRMHMRDVWKKFVGVNLDDYLDVDSMRRLCSERGYHVTQDERYEELFYRIFLHEIEPKFKDVGNIMVHHYPTQMASLSKISEIDPRYAERVEMYLGDIELANGFSELIDADEQRARLVHERDERVALGIDVYDVDDEFIDALRTMPVCAGLALGVDRLVQYILGGQNIDDVLPLPMSKIFE